MIPSKLGHELTILARLREEIRSDAGVCRKWGFEANAELLEALSNRLEQVSRETRDELLTLREASELSGYSRAHIAKLVRLGTIPNAGRHGAPRVKYADLPGKAVGKSRSQPHVDSTQIVQSIINGGN